MLNSDLLAFYRSDAPVPQIASSSTSGFAPGVSPLSKPMTDFGTFIGSNPNVTQSQDPDPRSSAVSTTGTTIYNTFDSKTFVIIAAIILGIWYLSR